MRSKTTSLCIFLFSFLFSTISFAQSVSGTLVDKSSNKTIPFATVQLGEDYGVITNQEGFFNINTKNFTENDSLIFSSMGYERRGISLKDFEEDTVYLTQNIEQLDAVLLLEEQLTATEIMTRVNENLEENYDFSNSKYTVFHRMKYQNIFNEIAFEIKKADFISKKAIREFNHAMDSIAQASKGQKSMYYDAFLSEMYVGKKDSVKANLIKATKLINEAKSLSSEDLQEKVFKTLLEKLKSANTFSVRTGIIPLTDSLDLAIDEEEDKIDSLKTEKVANRFKSILQEQTFKNSESFGFITEINDYKYNIEDVSTYNNELVYVISFFPDTGLFSGNGKYAGKLYISVNNFAILRADYHFADGEHGQKLNLKFLLGIKFIEDQHSGILIFEKNDLGKYVPKYIEEISGGFVYLSRKIVMKENDERDDRMKLKFDFTMKINNLNVNKWLFIDSESITESEFANFKGNDGVVREELSKYNPEIWKNYNILAPTEAIRAYE